MLFILLYFMPSFGFAQQQSKPTVDTVLDMFVRAAGGQAAIDNIRTRVIHGTIRGATNTMSLVMGEKGAARNIGLKVICYWEKPDKAMEIQNSLFGMASETGFDGTELWLLSSARKARKPDYQAREELETTANPLRYVYLKNLYPAVQLSAPESIDSRRMDVLTAANGNGVTKFYFDAHSHLLVDITEIGIVSSYYKRSVKLRNYKKVDGIEFPFRIAFTSPEPGAPTHEVRISKVKQNIEIPPEQFKRPRAK